MYLCCKKFNIKVARKYRKITRIYSIYYNAFTYVRSRKERVKKFVYYWKVYKLVSLSWKTRGGPTTYRNV